jgi:hypothetical protein
VGRVDRPSPVTFSGGFVVKNGSKIRAWTSGVIPVPVSRTVTETAKAGHADLEAQSSTGVHGIPGVRRKIPQHLLQLCRIDAHATVVVGHLDRDRDVLSDHPVEQALGLQHELGGSYRS